MPTSSDIIGFATAAMNAAAAYGPLLSAVVFAWLGARKRTATGRLRGKRRARR